MLQLRRGDQVKRWPPVEFQGLDLHYSPLMHLFTDALDALLDVTSATSAIVRDELLTQWTNMRKGRALTKWHLPQCSPWSQRIDVLVVAGVSHPSKLDPAVLKR
jgi:hypothetical protein